MTGRQNQKYYLGKESPKKYSRLQIKSQLCQNNKPEIKSISKKKKQQTKNHMKAVMDIFSYSMSFGFGFSLLSNTDLL